MVHKIFHSKTEVRSVRSVSWRHLPVTARRVRSWRPAVPCSLSCLPLVKSYWSGVWAALHCPAGCSTEVPLLRAAYGGTWWGSGGHLKGWVGRLAWHHRRPHDPTGSEGMKAVHSPGSPCGQDSCVGHERPVVAVGSLWHVLVQYAVLTHSCKAYKCLSYCTPGRMTYSYKKIIKY